MNKAELMTWLHEEQRQWEALIETVGEARMEQPGVNGSWSFKDMVAHLVGWQPRLIAQIQAAQRGDAEPAPPWPANLQSDDAVNAWIYEQGRSRSARELLGEARELFQELLATVAALPDDARIETIRGSSGREYYVLWLGERRFAPGEFFDHFRDDHEPDVQAWLARLQDVG